MTTTIQIDDETKKILFRIKLRLEELKGEAITYNDLIGYLIENQPSNLIRKSNLQQFRSLKGILPKSVKKSYLDEKRKDLKEEENLAPLKNKQK
ncbi:MAG TPA: hypothetical protein VMV43_11580 [Candidatus Nanopelagicaceae bacterium]|nr:hypothetical protein [Candidatus Nanopelagicaceae bacterium]